MTNKEAAKILDRHLTSECWSLSSDPEDTTPLAQAFALAIAALRPWKKLSEEKPKKNGRYLIASSKFTSHWVATWHIIRGFYLDNGKSIPDVTHWQERIGPEDD